MTGTDRDMSMLRVESLSRAYGPIKAADGVTFDVAPGEVHGLCGHNGAGKSTVVKMLSGLVAPDSGRIILGGREASFASTRGAQAEGVALVDQELSIVPTLTVLENLFLGNVGKSYPRNRNEKMSRARELLDGVGLTDLDPRDATESLSLGQRQLLEIARALGREANLLILDEPTATLSNIDIEHVFAAIRKVTASGRSVIYVSHRLDEVLTLCARVTVMRDGQVVGTTERKDLTGDSLVRMMLGEVPEAADIARSEDETADVRLRIENLSTGAKTRGIDIEARGGTIYALAGQIGSGATEVLRAIGGLAPDASGSVSVDGRAMPLGSPIESQRAGVAYVSGDRKSEGLFLGQSIELNLAASRLRSLSGRWGWLNAGLLKQVARKIGDVIGIRPERLNEPVERLSGGNQQKVLIGRFLEQAGTAGLLLDEPTRGVDVQGRADIHQLVRGVAGGGATVLFASTELDEILDLADVVITMRGGRIVNRYQRRDVDDHLILNDMTHSTTPEGAL